MPWRQEEDLICNQKTYEAAFIASGLDEDKRVIKYKKGKSDMDKAVELIRNAYSTDPNVECEGDEEAEDVDDVPLDDVLKRLNDMIMPV